MAACWRFRVGAGPELQLTLFALCIINLFTKQVATVSGIAFTLIFFAVFELSEKVTRKAGGAHVELDQFNVAQRSELTPESVHARPGNVLVPISNYHELYHLANTLDRVKVERRDIVVLHVRLLRAARVREKANSRPASFLAASSNTFSPGRFRWPKSAARPFAWP